MGDVRFEDAYERVRTAARRDDEIRRLTDDAVVMALAAASTTHDRLLANVLATEALNRTRRLRAALIGLGEGIVTLGDEDRILWMNPRAERLLGIAWGDAMGQIFSDVVGGSIESGVERGTTFQRPDGTLLPVSYTASAIPDPDGQPIGIVIAFQDATTRLDAERRLRESREWYKSLFDNTPDAIIAIDVDGHIVDINQAAELLTRRPAAQAKGRIFSEFVHDDDQEHMLTLFAAVVGGATRESGVRIRRGDGSYIIARAIGIPIICDGRVVGVHGILREE